MYWNKIGEHLPFRCLLVFWSQIYASDLSKAIKCNQGYYTKHIPVDRFLGMLDDFGLLIGKRRSQELLQLGRLADQVFDDEIVKMGITKSIRKKSPTDYTTVWFGFLLDTKDQTLAIHIENEIAVVSNSRRILRQTMAIYFL